MTTPSSASPEPPALLRVRALGELRIDGFDLRAIRSRKARTALKVLVAARGSAVSVDRLVDCLWPDGATPQEPEREVAVNLSRVRALLGRDRVPRADAGYRLEIDWLDLDVLDELAAEAHRRADAGDHAGARTVIAAALDLVRGPLLDDGTDAPWLDLERAATARTVDDLVHLAARAALAVGDLGGAVALAERALGADAYDEQALRMLMEAHRRSGRPGSALTAYAAMRDRLRDDLGASPDAATEELHLAILVDNDAGADGAASRAPEPDALTIELAGRARELAALAAAHAEAAAAVELVVVTGDPGVGKTRLAETFAECVRAGGAIAAVGRCDELGRGLPLQPVADALAELLHGGGPQVRAEVLGDDAEVLGPLLGMGAPGAATLAPGPAMTPDAQQALVFGALLRTLDRLSDRRPAALVIDDAHLAGSSTLEWLRFAVRRRREARGLVVVTARTHDGPPITGTRRMELGPLDLPAVRSIVGDDRAESLLRRSGGNPLLLVELADAPDGTVPGSVLESVSDRLRAAGPEVAATIAAAAVLGSEVDLDLLATVLDRPTLGLLTDLEQAVDRRFLDERGDRFVFCHALVRDALVASSSSARRALVHRRAAHALAARPAADPLVLAHHARLGGERTLAAEALVAAAEVAAWRSDLAEAERLLDDAVELDPLPGCFLARGKVRIARGDLAGADEDGLAAARAGLAAEALALRAWVARHRHDMALAIRLGTEGAAIAGDGDTRASCLLVVALAERGLGDLHGADDRLAEVVAITGADRSGVRGWTGVLRVHQGRPDDGLALLEPAVGTEADIVHGFWVEHVLQMAAHAQAMVGNPTRALALLERFRIESRRRGSDTRYRGLAENYEAWILVNLGDPRAPELNQEARSVATMPEMVVQATLDLAASCYQRGDLGAAADLAAGALRGSVPTSFSNRWRCEQRAALLQAQVALASGDPASASARAGALHAEVADRGDQRYEVLAALVDLRARHGLGDPVDLDVVDHLLRRLPSVAGMEAWWLTAETAATFAIDRWWSLADEQASALAAQAGDRHDLLVARVAHRHRELGRR